jgi:hypothetical protein
MYCYERLVRWPESYPEVVAHQLNPSPEIVTKSAAIEITWQTTIST